ncbi:amidohydrolase [Pleurocapsa sp. CCALA 161]|uniref:amidohydrolase family protein n=1 Tax=Pleurocapsa sp. CCALA 161 TaxID=2107688 RepID=UPI000D0653FC|nr:amidohydrolase family protein [Pleurocapsa sp. CCALA 161]PSB05751.1 amidohydrolase [Pleurocapsa sp. CCALA 161]
MDLKITNVTLPDRKGNWHVAIANGYIREVSVEPIFTKTDQTLDAQGKLLIPGLVDPHIHLDKALLLERYPAVEGTFSEAMQKTLQAKQEYTLSDIQSRASKIIEKAIAFGTTSMRTHVEVDPILQLKSFEALLPLKEKYAWGITLQLAVFAQEGITNQPGTIDLLRQAMAMGGDAIGSAPYIDPDPAANIRLVFDIAQEFDCDVDFHLDFLDDDSPLLLPIVIESTLKHNWHNRVCLGHMTKLAGLTTAALTAFIPQLKEAGIAILALPATDLYMMARNDTHNVRRGVAPIDRLAESGVKVGLATNNVQNLFTPFGDGDVLKICTLLAQVLQLGTTDSHRLCLEMATSKAAEAIGISDYGIAVGKVADLVLLDANSVSEAIAIAPIGRITIKRGSIVAQSKSSLNLKGNIKS